MVSKNITVIVKQIVVIKFMNFYTLYVHEYFWLLNCKLSTQNEKPSPHIRSYFNVSFSKNTDTCTPCVSKE